jgi:hypothetical protein
MPFTVFWTLMEPLVQQFYVNSQNISCCVTKFLEARLHVCHGLEACTAMCTSASGSIYTSSIVHCHQNSNTGIPILFHYLYTAMNSVSSLPTLCCNFCPYFQFTNIFIMRLVSTLILPLFLSMQTSKSACFLQRMYKSGTHSYNKLHGKACL